MRQCWQIVTQKFCLSGETSFPFEPKLCALIRSASLPPSLLQDPASCPAPVAFPKCQLCCYSPCALCSLFSAATTPWACKATGAPWAGGAGVVAVLSTVFGEVDEAGPGGGPGFAQKPSANARPPGVPWLRRQTQILCRETSKGVSVLWHNGVSHL